MSEEKNPFIVTKETIINDILMQSPFCAEILMDYGVGCVGCHVNEFETIGQGILGHGFSEGELDDIISELNEAITNPPSEDEYSNIPV